MDENLSVQWSDFQSNISANFRGLRTESDFTDVTLVCKDQEFQAHKLILSASSTFFKTMLQRTTKQADPIIFMRGVEGKDLEAVVDFIYFGEAKVLQVILSEYLYVKNLS